MLIFSSPPNPSLPVVSLRDSRVPLPPTNKATAPPPRSLCRRRTAAVGCPFFFVPAFVSTTSSADVAEFAPWIQLVTFSMDYGKPPPPCLGWCAPAAPPCTLALLMDRIHQRCSHTWPSIWICSVRMLPGPLSGVESSRAARIW
jgi:hypothetical protein